MRTSGWIASLAPVRGTWAWRLGIDKDPKKSGAGGKGTWGGIGTTEQVLKMDEAMVLEALIFA